MGGELNDQERTAKAALSSSSPPPPPNQPQAPEPVIQPPRTEAELLATLDAATTQKEAAVNAADFGRAADLRDTERALQQELRARFPPGLYRVRIDKPDGTYHVAESPTLAEAMELVGWRNITDEVAAVILAARMLEKVVGRLA